MWYHSTVFFQLFQVVDQKIADPNSTAHTYISEQRYVCFVK